MSIVKRVMYFVDGENLVMRFQEMKKAGREPLNAHVHIPDVCVWHSDIIRNEVKDILRVTYYTSATGDNERILEIKQNIKNIEYLYQGPRYGGGGRYGGSTSTQYRGKIFPKVFKKENKSAKSKGVDINLTIDMLNHAYHDDFDLAYLISGDGDFIPLIETIMRLGKRVYVMALSSGLNPQIPVSVDEFECIDSKLFKS
jgi:uncharacterized LabA/DUF88 family protein